MFSIPSELLSSVPILSLDECTSAKVKNTKFVSVKTEYSAYASVSKQYNDKTFTNCEFNSCKFCCCEFKNVIFDNSQLFYVEFDNCTFVSCKFDECLFNKTQFIDCVFDNMYFSESTLLGVSILRLSLINDYHSAIQYCMLKNTTIDIDSANNTKLILKSSMCHQCNVSQRSEQYILCNTTTTNYYSHCPETVSYIAYKKAFINSKGNVDIDVIVKLQILENAKRSSAGGNKCRASAAKVLSISSINKKTYYKKAYSMFDTDFIYEVGKIVKVSNFNENRWEECSEGIHHFLTRKEAEVY